MGWAFSTYWGEERCVQGFVEKSEFKKQLGRPTHRWSIILKYIFKNFHGGYGLD